MTCRDGYEKFAEHRMFFGRGSGELERVSDTDWERFLAEVLTPPLAYAPDLAQSPGYPPPHLVTAGLFSRVSRNSDGNPDSPQVVVFLTSVVDVTVGY